MKKKRLDLKHWREKVELITSFEILFETDCSLFCGNVYKIENACHVKEWLLSLSHRALVSDHFALSLMLDG